MSLTPQKIAFVEAYFGSAGFNATEAMILVRPELGSVPRAQARVAGHRMLSDLAVKEEIERRLVEWRAKQRPTVDAFTDQLLDAMRVDVSDFYDENGDLKPLSEIPPHARRQIASIDTEEHIINDEPVLIKRVKLWDRRSAEKMWGQFKKLFTEKVEHGGPDGGPMKVSFTMDFRKGQE